MQASAADPLLDLPAWQAILEREARLFAELAPGAAIGLVPRFVRGADGAARASAMPSVPATQMLVWERGGAAMRAQLSDYSGIASAPVDVLFFVEREALRAVLAHPEPMGEMTRSIRTGRILLMVLRTREQLSARGFEALFDALGLPFIGACR
jgi:hypothetical protein